MKLMKIIKPMLFEHMIHPENELCAKLSWVNAKDIRFVLRFDFIFVQAHLFLNSFTQYPFWAF